VLADWILTRPILAREIVTNHGDPWRLLCIGIVESFAAKYGNAHSREIARRYVPEPGDREGLVSAGLNTIDSKVVSKVSATHGHPLAQTGALHAGNVLHSIEKLFGENPGICIFGVTIGRKFQSRRQHVRRPKTRIDG